MLTLCPEWMERLSAYLDGESDVQEVRAVEAHLAQCPACRAAAEMLRCDTQDAAAALRAQGASEGFADRVLAQIAPVPEATAPADRYEEIIPARPRLHRRFFFELLAMGGILMLFAAILFPVFSKPREKARQTQCLNNQKQIVTSVQIYAQEHGETLPSADNWITEIDIPAKVLQCLQAKDLPIGYAYNRELSSRKITDFERTATDTPVTFDARDGLPDFRHGGASNSGLVMSFVDGHVAYVKREEISGNSVSGAPVLASAEMTNSTSQAAAPTIASPQRNYGLPEIVQLAYTASMSLESEYVQTVMGQTESLFLRQGGFVLHSEYQSSKGMGTATVTGRVPAEHLGAMLQHLGTLGKVTARTVSGEDVTAQHIDQLAKLQDLAGAQGNLGQIGRNAHTTNGALGVEQERDAAAREANSVRVEEYRLRSRVALAEVHVEIRGTQPLAPTGGYYRTIALGSARALHAFGRVLLTILIPLLIWIPVWGSVLGVVIYARRRGWLFRRRG